MPESEKTRNKKITIVWDVKTNPIFISKNQSDTGIIPEDIFC
jgi:hypothetical protein